MKTPRLIVVLAPLLIGGQLTGAAAPANTAQSTGWSKMGSWTVPAAATPLSIISVSPNSGNGRSQNFSFTFSDAAGAAAINEVYVIVSGAFSYSSACFFEYHRPSNLLWLANDADSAWQGSAAVGSAAAVSNSQCTISGSAASATISGNQLTLVVPLAFTSGFAGTKNVYVFALDSGANTGWQTKGTWTVPSGSTPPSIVSVTPASGNGPEQTFTFAVSDAAGASAISDIYVIIGGGFSFASVCFFQYNRPANTAWLANDGDSAWQGATVIGSGAKVSNGQCGITGAGASVVSTGNQLTLSIPISFSSTFAGLKNIYVYADDNANLNSGWQSKATWTVPSAATGPSMVSVIPASGTGSNQTFTFTLSDSAGATSLSSLYVILNAAFSYGSGCFFQYHRPSNTLWLANDSDSAWQGATAIGSGTAVSNSQCSISGGGGASVTASGNTLTVIVPISFTAAFAGTKSLYAYVDDSANLNSGWQTKGAWTVPGASAGPSIISVTPSAGSGSSQAFTFTMSDPAGASAINSMYVIIGGSLSYASSCFFQYYRPSNMIWLANDSDSAWQGAAALGSGAAVSNGQCSISGIGASSSSSGTQLIVTVPVVFKQSGPKNIYVFGENTVGMTSGWQAKSSWTAP